MENSPGFPGGFGSAYPDVGERESVLVASRRKLLADGGDADAHFSYGCCLMLGDNINQNHVKAAEYFKLSADRGNSRGQVTY
jgi:TPR repeat protein